MDEAQAELVERMGRHYEAEGLPRIGGRLYGFVLLQEVPCSLDELAEQLEVSKTSVSVNARLLEQVGLIERVTKPGDRKDYYRAAPDQTKTLALRLAGVEQMGALLRRALEVLPPGRPDARDRLEVMCRFNEEGFEVLSALLDRWKR